MSAELPHLLGASWEDWYQDTGKPPSVLIPDILLLAEISEWCLCFFPSLSAVFLVRKSVMN